MVRPSWSWAQSPREAEEFQSEAATLVGETLVTVLYIDLDYRADEFRGDAKGPRPIRSADEWEKPTWRHPSCDTVDMAVELHTESGRKFTVAWESPGRIEGLGLRGMPAMGTAVSEGADLAVWDVSERSAWVNLIGQDVRTVTLHYEPWGEGAALWCRWITISPSHSRDRW